MELLQGLHHHFESYHLGTKNVIKICQHCACQWPNATQNQTFNTLRPRQNGRHFPDDIFKCTFLNENVWISIKISLKFVPGGPNNNFPALVQIMAWRRPGDKPSSELVMVSLLTHICVNQRGHQALDKITAFNTIDTVRIQCKNLSDSAYQSS